MKLALLNHHDLLSKLVKNADTIILYRATPAHKADLVQLIKENSDGKVLAIGDGSNDVNMLV